mmetsp:Transcript_6483/g.14165  ORF Transcript_6483/g.14165 Transcript_6483/m.14165 type:complete len:596 (+) Transcript_6483:66-1853(+)
MVWRIYMMYAAAAKALAGAFDNLAAASAAAPVTPEDTDTVLAATAAELSDAERTNLNDAISNAADTGPAANSATASAATATATTATTAASASTTTATTGEVPLVEYPPLPAATDQRTLPSTVVTAPNAISGGPNSSDEDFIPQDLAHLRGGKFYTPPPDLADVMPRADQVWNVDEIGFDPDNWITHNNESGYMDRDGFLKAATAFIQMTGASVHNPQFLFLDGHDSHWDSDALDLLAANHVYIFFLKSGDSENDQPLDNGPNCLVKQIYDEEKEAWDTKWQTTPYTPYHFNFVIAKTWQIFMRRNSEAIVSSFEKTCLHPLKFPPADSSKVAGNAAIAAMQIAPGKVADELSRIKEQHTIPYSVERTTDPQTILRAKEVEADGKTRALMIRTSVWDVVNTTLVVPTQEAKKAAQLQASAKQINLGTGAVDTSTRMNQDTSAGLWMNGTARARARMVQKNKKEAEVKAAESKKKAALERERLAGERAELFEEYSARIRGKGVDAIDDKGTKAQDLVKILQHLGVRPVDIPDKKRPATVSMLRERPEILAIAQDAGIATSSTAGDPIEGGGGLPDATLPTLGDADGGTEEELDDAAI